MIVFYLFVILLSISGLQAVSVGSKTVVSSQGPTTFPAVDTNNTMLGYAIFENGFTLESNLTTCTYDNFQPVSGAINMNGGSLYLLQDLVFSNTLNFRTAGKFFANNRSIEFSKNISSLSIPANGVGASLTLATVASQAAASSVNSVSWSFDDQYISAVSNNSGGGQELKVYYFDGAAMTSTQSIEQGRTTNTTCWHPSKLFLAVGRSGGTGAELQIYKLNVSNGTIPTTDTRDYSTSNLSAVAWHPSGSYLIAGTAQTSAELVAYSFDQTTGVLTNLTTFNLNPNRTLSNNSISFAPGGNYFVIGTSNVATAGETEVLIFGFNGSSLTLTASADIGNTVNEVDWCPTGSYIAVGINAGTERLRIYQHNILTPQQLVEIKSARVGETKSIQAVNWDSTGSYLLVGTSSGISSDMKIYYFNKTNLTLNLISTIASSTSVNDARWAHSGLYIVRGNASNNVIISGLANPRLLFQDATIILNSDMVFTVPTYFVGNCKINGRGKRLTIQSNVSSMFVRPGGSLILEDVELQGLSGSNLRCMTDNGSITVRSSILSLAADYTFSRGSLFFDEDVIVAGARKFALATRFTNTINTASTLLLSNGVTFSYAPTAARSNLLYMPDQSSILYLSGCTLHSTRTGIQLSLGTLIVDDKVTFSSEAKNSGEAMSLKSDLNIRLLGNAELELFGRINLI